MSKIVGVFESRERAREAIEALQEEGFSEEDLSIIARQDQGQGQGQGGGGNGGGDLTDDITQGAAWGGGLGALGGLLAGAGALAIPGIGPILAAGPLAAGLSGAVAGGIAGGLIDLGIPEDAGQQFEEDVKQGRLLAIVETDEDDQVGRVQRLLEEYGADEVQSYR